MVSLHAPSASAIAIPAKADALPSLTMTFTLRGLPAVPAGTNASRASSNAKTPPRRAGSKLSLRLAVRTAQQTTAPDQTAERCGPGAGFALTGNRPSRCSFLRASLRARRTASAFSRALFSDGFS